MSTKALTRVSLHTIAGLSFLCSAWTAGGLDATIARLAKEHPNARLEIIQPCYNTGVQASAGTHDKDAVLDVRIVGLSWSAAQRFLRSCGWAAWHRTPAQGFGDHIHMILIAPGLRETSSLAQVAAAYDALGIEIGDLVAAQVYDYLRHSYGLKGHHDSGADPSWFPPFIADTIYDPEDLSMYTLTEAVRRLAADRKISLGAVAIAALRAARDGNKPGSRRRVTARGALTVLRGAKW